MKRYSFIFLLAIVLSSCAAIMRSFKPNNFTFLYDGVYTGLDTLINIDGYYYSDSLQRKMFFLFYKDGIVAQTGRKQSMDENKGYYDISLGVYKIVKDTIVAQVISNLGGTRRMETITKKFVIKSRNELEYYSSSFMESTQDDIIIEQIMQYYPYPNRLDSAHWVKNHSWFWKDKKAYEAYKKNEKSKKK